MNKMPKDLDKIKFELSEKLEFLKENAESEEEIEKLNNFASYWVDKYFQIDDEDIKTEKLNRINTGLSYYQRFKKAFTTSLIGHYSHFFLFEVILELIFY